MEIPSLNMADQVYAVLRKEIEEDRIHLGERLPIGKLAQRLGVSPTPVREALNRLLVNGLADWHPHRGIFVVAPDEAGIHDLCQARLALEQFMGEAVVTRATARDVRRLYQLVECLLAPQREGAAFRPTDFHRYYAALAGNAVLESLHNRVLGPLNLLFARAVALLGRDALVAHARDETTLCRAIEDRDLARLKQALQLHTDNLQVLLRQAQEAYTEAERASSPRRPALPEP
jgi:DNA-binding GntR family transcriptional regulator